MNTRILGQVWILGAGNPDMLMFFLFNFFFLYFLFLVVFFCEFCLKQKGIR